MKVSVGWWKSFCFCKTVKLSSPIAKEQDRRSQGKVQSLGGEPCQAVGIYCLYAYVYNIYWYTARLLKSRVSTWKGSTVVYLFFSSRDSTMTGEMNTMEKRSFGSRSRKRERKRNPRHMKNCIDRRRRPHFTFSICALSYNLQIVLSPNLQLWKCRVYTRNKFQCPQGQWWAQSWLRWPHVCHAGGGQVQDWKSEHREACSPRAPEQGRTGTRVGKSTVICCTEKSSV